jgi:hypothetical protein
MKVANRLQETTLVAYSTSTFISHDSRSLHDSYEADIFFSSTDVYLRRCQLGSVLSFSEIDLAVLISGVFDLLSVMLIGN